MGVELPLYALPVPGGFALAAPASSLRSIEAAAKILARRPQECRVVVLAPHGTSAAALATAAKDVARRAAARALADRGAPQRLRLLPKGLHALLVVVGALLLLDAAGVISQVVAGIWLLFLYPLFRASARSRARTQATEPAEALGDALDTAAVDVRSHAGLTMLAQTVGVGATGESAGEIYARLAIAARGIGLEATAAAYDDAARGATTSLVWAPVLTPQTLDTGASVRSIGAPRHDEGSPNAIVAETMEEAPRNS